MRHSLCSALYICLFLRAMGVARMATLHRTACSIGVPWKTIRHSTLECALIRTRPQGVVAFSRDDNDELKQPLYSRHSRNSPAGDIYSGCASL